MDGQLLIDQWIDPLLGENSGQIALSAGEMHSIRMEHFEGGNVAEARLVWSSASTPKAVVP